MATKNRYQAFVDGFARLLTEGGEVGATGLPRADRPLVAAGALKALIFAPHPDDEVIIGGLPLRLLRELKINVVNVAVTLGSRQDRQAERWQELKNCCDYIGFGLVVPRERGLEGINPVTREKDPERWSSSVKAIADLLIEHRPSIIFFPHDDDWNKTHIGVHYLVLEALGSSGLACQVVETEYWGAMDAPNLMVESSAADVADLVAALSLHVGEVARNAYHLRLPAWMIDNVRRGAELVGGQGGTAPRFAFATLYRLRRWENGRFHDVFKAGQVLSNQDDLSKLFQPQR
ncbi:MAG TPA: PIG-L family deacetylase [Chthoniobacterales bacterium]